MSHPLYEKHRTLLERAAAGVRGGWHPYAEQPHAYGEDAPELGRQAFESCLDAQFYLDQPGVAARIGAEISAYGLPLNIGYPRCDVDALISAAKAAQTAWIKAGPDARAGVCAEILARLNTRSHEIAHAVMHATGQSLAMAFPSGGPEAQAHGLEAVAAAWRTMRQLPETDAEGEGAHRTERRFALAPLGVALVIANAYAPTGSSYPGLFASLATGNPVIVKPHWTAVLPLAITVAVMRQTLKEAGFEAGLVSLLVDDPDAQMTRFVATKPDIRIIDYAGGPDHAAWLTEHARQALLFVRQSGVNAVVIDSTADYTAMLKGLAVALCLNSGQMDTTPRVIFVPRGGVGTPAGTIGPERLGRDLSTAISRLLDDPRRAVDVLGAIRSPAALARIEAIGKQGEALREPSVIVHPQWPQARIRSPLLLKADAADPVWRDGSLGPVAFVVETATTAESLALAEKSMAESGAASFIVHSTSEPVRLLAENVFLRTRVPLALNVADGILLTQLPHVVDAAFVASRFSVIPCRQAVS